MTMGDYNYCTCAFCTYHKPQIYTWPSISTEPVFTFPTAPTQYVPKHRKPGPAQ
jgi:hypothetical protein